MTTPPNILYVQIVQNDMGRGKCPAQEVVLVVVDEAHKASGNHAYCQVFVWSHINYLRPALHATLTPPDATVVSIVKNEDMNW